LLCNDKKEKKKTRIGKKGMSNGMTQRKRASASEYCATDDELQEDAGYIKAGGCGAEFSIGISLPAINKTITSEVERLFHPSQKIPDAYPLPNTQQHRLNWKTTPEADDRLVYNINTVYHSYTEEMKRRGYVRDDVFEQDYRVREFGYCGLSLNKIY
jgi:hypothetical protein